MVVDIAGVRQGVSELLYRPSIQSLLQFCCTFEVKFWFPQFGRTGPLWGWAFLVSYRASVTSYRSHYKALDVCYGFAAVFNLFFDYPNFGRRGAPRWSTMVPLGR